MNYLDLLTDDLIEKILDKLTDDISNEIDILNEKMENLKEDLENLIIEPFEGFIHITYDYVSYSIDKYLFSKFETEKDIVLINVYDDFFGEEDGETYISDIMVKPTYYDILKEANKSIIITGDYDHTFLEGLNHIPNNKLFEYSGITPNEDIDYYEIMLGS